MINLLFLFVSNLVFAGPSRGPAVLDSACDLNVSNTNAPLIEIQKEQCKRVHQCMNSAANEEMPELKKLEALVCKGELIPVTTSVPKIEVNKAEMDDHSRHEKELNKENSIPVQNPTSVEK